MQGSLLHAVVFKLRGLLMAPLVVLLAVSTYWETEDDAIVCIAGGAFFLSGVMLRLWSQRHLKYRTDKEHGLAVTGPYQYVRNPVYLGNMLILASLAVFCELLWAVPLALLWSGSVYAVAVRFEEVRLAKCHGEAYQRYHQSVPGWVPRLSGFGSRPQSAPASWNAVWAAEWQCAILLLIPLAKEYATHSLI